MHIFGIEGAVEELDVATAAVHALLVLDGELHDQGLVLIGERLELSRYGVELFVLAGIDFK